MKKIFLLITVLIITISVLGCTKKEVDVDKFSQCLTDNGAVLYGAFWCGNCNDQKEMFGSAVNKLNYVECSNPDRTQTEECKNMGIKGVPTWIFNDGTRISGTQSFEKLSELSGCQLK